MKAFVKKHKKKLLIVAVIAALAVGYFGYYQPFRYIDVSKYTLKQRRAIVAELKKIEANAAMKKAIEEGAAAAKVSYRKALEEAALLAYKTANPA